MLQPGKDKINTTTLLKFAQNSISLKPKIESQNNKTGKVTTNRPYSGLP